ncbi:MAG: cysteine desulfurase family protein, partial [Eggerthellaceae bacterium]
MIVSAVEHDAVLEPCKRLEAEGFRITRLVPNREGFVEVRALEDAIDGDTVLVSVQAANSEVGSIQPVAELARVAHAAGALMHTDAVQALGKVRIDLEELGVDAASFSAHKIGGPKGVGALYLKARTPFAAQMLGGGQESGRRSGTQNVAGAAGFAAACREAVEEQELEAARLRGLRDRLYGALASFDAIEATVDVARGSEDFLPNIVHVLAAGLESETLI